MVSYNCRNRDYSLYEIFVTQRKSGEVTESHRAKIFSV
jgi:hypothetical protein